MLSWFMLKSGLHSCAKKWALGLAFLGISVQALAAGGISVSNYPLYLLSEAVTKGTDTQVTQLLDPGDVGHHGSLSPSDKRVIQESRFVIWFGAALEQNLKNTLEKSPNAIALFDFKQSTFKRLPLRDVFGKPIKNSFDPHIWLDPNNAKAIVRALASIHSQADPKNEKIYQDNAKKFAIRLDQAVAEVQKQTPKSPSYWAYHDAYQYLEATTKIKLAGTLTPDHHLPPKASQFKWLNAHRPNAQMCVVMQGEASAGMKSKLAPIATTLQQEDMSQTKDFVAGWKEMASQIYQCIDGKSS